MRRLVQFSGGLVSWWTLYRSIAQYGRENVRAIFADTLIEDEDLYQFNRDTESFFGLKLIVISDGRTPWEVFEDEGVIGRSGLDVCSRILKRDLIDKWCRENSDPMNETMVLGLDWTENHRLVGRDGRGGIQKRLLPWKVETPMMNEPLWDKRRMARELPSGVKLPRLYSMGFPHNNCGGFCVKAGHAHFAHLLKTMPERYAFHEAKEESLRARLGDFSVLKDRRFGQTKSLPLRVLRLWIEQGIRNYDELDWGGCGCSVEEDPAELI